MQLSMYALERGADYALRAMAPLLDVSAPKTWIHVAYAGTWKGHRAGEFTLSRDTFAQMISNFERLGNPIPLDWEHATVRPGVRGAPAAGWIRDLRVIDDDLYAFVEFTATAAEQVKAGEYKFCSGVFVRDATLPQSAESIGWALESVALTNVPFIRGQKPIELTARDADGEIAMSQDTMAQVRKILGLDKTATSAQVLRVIKAQEDLRAALAGEESGEVETVDEEDKTDPTPPEGKTDEAPVPPPPSAPAPTSAKVATSADAVLQALAGMSPEDLQAVLAKVQEMLGAGGGEAPTDGAAFKAVASQRDELAKRVTDLEGKILDTEIGDLVRAGRILDAERDKAREWACKDRDAFKAIYLDRPAPVPTGMVAASSRAPAPVETAEDTAEIDRIARGLSIYARDPKRAHEIALTSWRAEKARFATAR